MKKVIKCCLVVTLGLAVVGYSKEESSRSGAISIKDCGHKGVQLWQDGPYCQLSSTNYQLTTNP